jgi:hypothetical protein
VPEILFTTNDTKRTKKADEPGLMAIVRLIRRFVLFRDLR